MKNKLISVVVIIYNIEKYLDDCIESIVNQSYENLEIILVDDGSTDTSRIICEKWKQIDNRIILYRQKNQGVSEARNQGIKKHLVNIHYCCREKIYHRKQEWLYTEAEMQIIC